MTFSYFDQANDSAINVAKDMRDGLRLALGEQDKSLSNQSREESVVGVSEDLLWSNKAIYRATTEMESEGELPILYSWFRYGPSVPIPLFHVDNIEPVTLGDYERDLDQTRDGSTTTVYSYFEFFSELIREDGFFDPDRNLSEYLLDLYQSEAPSDYRCLYKNNIKLQKLLSNIKAISRTTTITEGFVDNYFQSFESVQKELEKELYATDTIPNGATDHVLDFLYLVEDVIEGLKSVDVVSTSQEGPLSDMWYKYQSNVWVWPAHWISYQTTDRFKPAGNAFRGYLEERVSESQSAWSGEVRELRNNLRNQDVIQDTQGETIVDIGQSAVTEIDKAIIESVCQSATSDD